MATKKYTQAYYAAQPQDHLAERLSIATGAAKDKYRHARPFMLDAQPTCQPSADEDLRSNGSYPSGHTSIGWTWALVLAEVAPDRAEELLERGPLRDEGWSMRGALASALRRH